MRTVVKSTCLALTLIIPGHAQAITTNDLKTARPEILLKSMYAACRNGSQEQMFSLLSKSLEQALSQAPAERRRTIFTVYCEGVRQVVDQQLGGRPENASYFVKQSDRTHNGQPKATLCIVPRGQPAGTCKLGFDVTIENGQLKKDEF